MKIELSEMQEKAISRLKTGSILCGGVGSGKSRTALAYYFSRVLDGKLDEYKPPTFTKDLYIITTARKRDTLEWDDECGLFLLSRNTDHSVNNTKVVIDSWNNIEKYKKVEDAFFIFDEQRVVGYGKWATTFIKLAKKNDWILLSATPGDTWSDYMAVFIANGFYKNKTEFVNKHIVYDRFVKYPKIKKYIHCEDLIRHRKDVLVNMKFVRSTVSHRKNIKTEYDKEKYNVIFKDRWNVYTDEPIRDISSCCYLLRRVVNSDPSKMEALTRILEEHPKAIVFYNYDYELDMLRQIQGLTIAEWNGHKHEPIPDTDRWVYLVQYSAGAEGWNCITTDTIVFFSDNYSYKMMRQASGRINRMNTPFKDLYYYHLLSASSIDNGIRNSLAKKKNFNESAFINE